MAVDPSAPHVDLRPIGVFDSGVGGLTVVRALRRVLPAESVIYLGDTARVPYGTKSPRTVERYSLACQRFLLDRDVKLVMVACNTASANALSALASASDVPVIGAVRPGAQASVEDSSSQRIGVIGTLATIASRAYERAIAELDASAHVSSLACPLLVPLAEEGWTDGPIATAIVERYRRQLCALDSDIDTLVLGCTHYPLLKGEIERLANAITSREIRVVDSASAMAGAASALLGDRANRADSVGALNIFVTDATRMQELSTRFLGERASGFELVDL